MGFAAVDDSVHLLFEVGHLTRIRKLLALLLGTVLEGLLEDATGKLLYHARDVPTLARLQLLLHIIHNPALHILAVLHVLYHTVNGTGNDLVVVEFHL